MSDGQLPDAGEDRRRFADRLDEADVLARRFIGVKDGEKGTRTPGHQQPDNWLEDDDGSLSGNYGVHPGHGLIEFDVDDYDDEHDTDALDALPETFTVASPHTDDEAPGHRYYAVDDIGATRKVLKDITGTLNPEPSWGEVKYEGKYVVGPGSQLNGCTKEWCDACDDEDGGYYRIVEDVPIATLTAGQIADVLRADPEFSEDDEESNEIDKSRPASEQFDLDDEKEIDADDDAEEYDEYLGEDDVREALGHIHPDQDYTEWAAIGFALEDFFDHETAETVFREWSQGKLNEDHDVTTWDSQSSYYIEDIASGSSIDDGADKRTIATVIHHAKKGGWQMPSSPHSQGGGAGDDLPQPLVFEVNNGGYGYMKRKERDGEVVTEWIEWTNFQIEVTSFLVMDDGNEEISLTVHPRSGEPYDVTIEPTTFNEKREFKAKIAKGRTTTFTGGEEALAKIKYFVGTQAAPDRRGVRHMGLHGDEFVTPNGTLTADGWTDEPDTVHIPREIEAERRFSLSPDDGDEFDEEAVRKVLELLPQTRDLERFIPALGWFYATPIRPLIYEWTDEFNHLSITGETESGKTSTLSMLWGLFGMRGDPLTADDTKFAIQVTLGSSNAVPMWFDEYKPSDMSDYAVDTFHNELRKTTRGGTAQRGRPDGSTYAFSLHAPTVISGEERVQGPAEERRGIFSTFRSATVTEGSPHSIAYAKVVGGSAKVEGEVRHYEGVDTTDHALAYYRWILDQDEDELQEIWRETATHVNQLLQAEGVDTLDNLVEQGLRTVKFGCTLYRAFASDMGLSLAEVDGAGVSTDAIDDALLYVATSSTGGQNRQSHLDTFLSIAGRAAHSDYLEEGEHYKLVYKGQEREELRLNLSRAYDPISKYVRDYDVSEDLLGSAGDYRERVADGEGHVPYIREVSQPTDPISRCIGIHTDTAEGVIDGFDRNLFAGEAERKAGAGASDGAEGGVLDDATPIRSLEHGGNPYHTVTVIVLTADQDAPENGPAITGTLEDASGVIDFLSWADSEAVDEIANAEGENVVIERARLSTDREGDDVIDVENATVERISEGVGYISHAEAEPNATLSDGGGVEMDQHERIELAVETLASVEDASADGADRDDVIDRLTDGGLTEEQAKWALTKLLENGRTSELPNGRYTVK